MSLIDLEFNMQIKYLLIFRITKRMENFRKQIYFFLVFTLLSGCASRIENNIINSPFKGVNLSVPAKNWQTSFLTGNGTHGVMVPGDALVEKQIFCHEALFMPQYPPVPAPDLASRLSEIRELIISGKNREAGSVNGRGG